MFVTVGSCVYIFDSVFGQQGKYSLAEIDKSKLQSNSSPELGRFCPEEYEQILRQIYKDLDTIPHGTRSSPQMKCPVSSKKESSIGDNDFLAENFYDFKDLNIGTFGDISKANYLSAEKVDIYWVLRLCVRDGEQSEMSIRQLQNLRNCQSQFVPRYFGAYDSTSSDDLSKYVILENLSLGTLADYSFWGIERKQISEHAIKYVVASVMSGVSFIHSQDIIFLGVTPHHIGIDDKGKVKLFDFGWSHHKDDRPWEDPGYVGWSRPPEILTETPLYDEKVDSFAIGVLAFFLHFNRSPFEDDTVQECPEEEYDTHLQHMTELCDVVISAQLRGCTSLAQDFISLHTRCDPSVRLEVNTGQNGHIWLEGYGESNLSSMDSPLLPVIQNANEELSDKEANLDPDPMRQLPSHSRETFFSAKDFQSANRGHLDPRDNADKTDADGVNCAAPSIESVVLNSILAENLENYNSS